MPTTPYLNVSRAPSGRYRAELYTRGRRYHLGLYGSAEEAARAVAIARPMLPGPIRAKRHRVMIPASSISPAHERALRRRVVERLATYERANPQPQVEAP